MARVQPAYITFDELYMGRTKLKKVLQKTTAAHRTETAIPVKALPLTSSIYEKAQGLVVQCNYDLAQKFLLRVLEQEPGHTGARELLGEVLLEVGDIDAAKQVCLCINFVNTVAYKPVDIRMPPSTLTLRPFVSFFFCTS